MSLIKEYQQIILDIIVKHLPRATVLLYGSCARGDEQSGSDIDVAIDAGQKISSETMAKILLELDDSDLPIMFDIVDLHVVAAEL